MSHKFSRDIHAFVGFSDFEIRQLWYSKAQNSILQRKELVGGKQLRVEKSSGVMPRALLSRTAAVQRMLAGYEVIQYAGISRATPYGLRRSANTRD
jgi:hypothetical protein